MATWHHNCFTKTGRKPNDVAFFASKWHAKCELCGQPIERGQQIVWQRSPRATDTPSAPTVPTYTPSAPQRNEPQPPQAEPLTLPVGSIRSLVDMPNVVDTPLDSMDSLVKTMVPAIKRRLGYELANADTTTMQRELSAYIDAQIKAYVQRQNHITVTVDHTQDGETVETRQLGPQHKLFPTLLRLAQARRRHDKSRLNIWLSGPAGSGKTTAAKNVAESLGLDFGFCGALDAKYDLSGFINAAGICVNTEFRRLYTTGGVFLLDELDSWHPQAQLWLNAALANGEASFPDGTQKRHADFVCIGAANTWGLGATADYVGRTRLDAAFLDRFSAKLSWDYDEDLELAIAGDVEWTKLVHAMRAKAKLNGVKVIISPRKSIDGVAMLDAGFTKAEVLNMSIFAGLSADDRRKLEN